MISGYYLFYKNEINIKMILKKIKSIWVRAFICSVSIYIILVILRVIPFGLIRFFQSFFPIMSNRYWFVTVFILIIIIRPFLGKILNTLTLRELGLLICALLFFDSIQTTFGNNGFAERGYGFLHALTMIILGYGVSQIKKLQIKLSSSILLYMLSIISAGIISVIEKIISDDIEARVLLYNSPFIILASLGMFCFFCSINVNNRLFSKIAPHVLTIYLINDQPEIREYFWSNVLHCSNAAGSNMMVIHYILCLFGFVIVGLLSDYLICNFIKWISGLIRKRRDIYE